MSTYVTSDAHGHVVALKEALEAAGVTEDDELYVLGDMIDRGPDPLGVISLVRSMPNAHVLMGNHEDLMLKGIDAVGDPQDGAFSMDEVDGYQFSVWMDWMNNGGSRTSTQLEQLEPQEYADVLDWVRGLGFFECVTAGERTYILTHAGINPFCAQSWLEAGSDADLTDMRSIESLMEAQESEDLMWVRGEFWGRATGLVNERGEGPVVIAGHTPSPYLTYYADVSTEDVTDEDGRGKIVELGACEATGGVADRVDIDSAAAMGFGAGRVGVMRLEDRACFYAAIREGE